MKERGQWRGKKIDCKWIFKKGKTKRWMEGKETRMRGAADKMEGERAAARTHSQTDE